MKLTPADVARLTPDLQIQEIKSLDLSDRSISQIDDISCCVGLHRLDLSGNELASVESIAGIQYNKGLTWLSLAKNHLSDVDCLRNLRKLTVFNLASNELFEIPHWLRYFTQLRALILNSNRFVRLERPLALPESISTIVISDNQIDSLGGLSDRRFSQLTKISAARNDITELPPTFAKHLQSLRELRLADNKIALLSIASLPNTLEIIDLSNNPLQSFE